MRNRLTHRTAAVDKTPFPGTLNFPERKDADMDKYDNYDETVNHGLQDLRHEWKEDQKPSAREENNLPKLRASAVRVTAAKAVRVAVLLLGDKVSDSVIERQARDLMPLGSEALDRTLKRFADTQSLYTAAEAPAPVAEDPAPAAEAPAPVAEAPAPAPAVEATAPAVEAPAPVAEAPAPAVETPAPVKACDAVKADATVETPVEVAVEEEVPAVVDAPAEAPAECESPAEEIDFADDGDIAVDACDSQKLADIFGAGLPEEVPAVKVEAKTGIKKLGFQPKVASAQGESELLSSIWQSAPDVNSIF